MSPPPPENATLAAGARRRVAARESSSSPIPPTDGELLGLFADLARKAPENPNEGEAAFRQLVDRHGPMVWRVCRQVLPRHQDAEDAFQATFLILARRASAIRSSESAAGWLYRVAHRTALAARRRGHKRRETRMETEPLAPPEVAFPDLAGRETAAVMMEELATLPTNYRTPLVQRYLEGRSRREIAEQSDTTIATVQGRLARGKALLRSRLLRRGVSLSMAMTIVAGGSKSQAAEGVPAQLITQTTSNATAALTGGSLAASTAVVLLYREGLRAMFVNQTLKPMALVVLALLLASGAALGAGESADVKPIGQPETLVLDATPPLDEAVAEGAATFVANLAETKVAADADSAVDNEEQVTATLTIKEWQFDANGIARDPLTNNPLKDEELERRIRKFYAASPPDTVRSRSPLLVAESRYAYWSYRAQELRRETDQLRTSLTAKDGSGQVTDDDIRRLSSLMFDAGLAQANAIEHEQELRRLLAADAATTAPANAGKTAAVPSSDSFAIAGVVTNSGIEIGFPVETRPVQESPEDAPKAGVEKGSTTSSGTGVDSAKKPATITQKDRKTLAPDDQVFINQTTPAGAITQMALKVNAKGQVNLSEYSNNKYGVVQLAGLTPKQAAAVVAERIREADNAPGTTVSLQVKLPSGHVAASNEGAKPGPRTQLKSAATNLNDYKLTVGQRVRVQVSSANGSFNRMYRIERFGTIALGPAHGRVKIAGLSIGEAEAAISERFSERWRDVAVQVTEASPPSPPSDRETAAVRATPKPASEPLSDDFRLAPDDTLDLTVWDDRSGLIMSGGWQIDEKGWVKLENVGEAFAAGRTLSDLQQALLRDARKRLNKPELQIRLMHDRFGVVGGADLPGKVSEREVTSADEKRETPQVLDEQLDEIEKLLDEAEKGFALADKLTERMTRENYERVQAMNVAAGNQASQAARFAHQKLLAWHRSFATSALEKDDPLTAWEGDDKKRLERAEVLSTRLSTFGAVEGFGGFQDLKQQAVMDRFNARVRELFPERYKQADEAEKAEDRDEAPPAATNAAQETEQAEESPEPVDELLAEIEPLLEKAEADAAEALRLARRAARARSALGSVVKKEPKNDAVTRGLRKLSDKYSQWAARHLDTVTKRIEKWIDSTLQQDSSRDLEAAQERLSASSRRQNQIVGGVRRARLWAREGVLRKFTPEPGLGGPQNVGFFERDNNQRGMEAELPLGGKLTPKNTENEINFELELIAGDSDSVTLRTPTGPKADGSGGPQEFIVPDGWPAGGANSVQAKIRGKRFKLSYYSPWHGNLLRLKRASSTTPYANIEIRYAKSAPASQTPPSPDAGQ